MHTKITVVRHGRTDWNLEGRVQGSVDRPLDEVGKEQAKEIALKLKGVNANYIYSSDLLRAQQTAQIIAKHLDLTCTSSPDLRELCYGKIEGMLWRDFSEEYAKAIDHYSSLPWENRKMFAYTDTSETYHSAMARVLGFFHQVCMQNPLKHMIVVTHGGIIKGLLAEILGVDDRMVKSQNTGFVTLKYEDQAFAVEEIQGVDIKMELS